MKKITAVFIVICLWQNINAQTSFSFGLGLSAAKSYEHWEQFGSGSIFFSAELRNTKFNFVSLEFRTKMNAYFFNQEEDFLGKKEDLDIRLYSPAVSVVPKFIIKIVDNLVLQIENEVSINYISGRITSKEYFGKKKIKLTTLCSYTPAISLRGNIGNAEASLGVGYSFLDFSNTVNKYIPESYQRRFKQLKAEFTLTMVFYFSTIKF